MKEYVLCERLHRVTSKVEIPCECGGHVEWTCHMRVGNRSCGWRWLFPALARECVEDDEQR